MRAAGVAGVAVASMAPALVLVLAGTAAAELRGHGGPVRAMAANGAGEVLTGSFDTRAILWDGSTGAAEQVMRLHEGSVTAVAFLPDGGIVTGGQEGRVALWRRGAREPERVLVEHGGPVTALAVAPDGAAVASSAWDGTARVTDLGDGSGEGLVLAGHADNVNGVGFLPGGGIATADYDGTLRLWDATGGAAGSVGLGVPLNALAVDGAGTIWLAGGDGVLRVFDGRGVPVGELAVGAAPLVAVAVAPDGETVAVGAIDGTVTVVEVRGLVPRPAIPASSGPVWSVAFNAEGAVLAGAADHVVRPWDAMTGAPLADSREDVAAEAFGDSRGAQVFRMCAACHTLGPDDGNRAGPTLHGIFGRPIASAEGFAYSEALRDMDIVWTPETVAELFEIGPMAMTPGTSMPEQRIPDARDRAALVDFLREHAHLDDPPGLPRATE